MHSTPAAPERIGHRGAPRDFLENTLPSFERALELGADAIELDVHATADGVVVVHHDPVLGNGVPAAWRGRPLSSISWGELQGIELASGVTVPSLSQVLDLVSDRATVYVEIKGHGIEAVVAETLDRAGAATRCAVHSFDHDAIARMATLAPDIPRGLLFDRTLPDVRSAMARADARDAWPSWKLVDRTFVAAVHGIGGRVVAWTVNTRATAAHLRALGVDGICTDDLLVLGAPSA